MKLTLQFKQTPNPKGYNDTFLTHIKLLDDEGKYIKFLKHDPELIEFLEEQEIILPLPQARKNLKDQKNLFNF